jgi:hypothetical protein
MNGNLCKIADYLNFFGLRIQILTPMAANRITGPRAHYTTEIGTYVRICT